MNVTAPAASDPASRGDDASSGLSARTSNALVAGLVATGLLVRVLPLVQGADLLVRQPSEDGYLMLTVARNIAVGLGMSTAAGTIPTNGVQPLATFLFAGCFRLAGGDKVVGVGLVMALSVVVAALAALAVRRLGRVVFAERGDGDRLATLAAALWFASPVIAAHSMNALETGLYLLTVAVILRYVLVHAADPGCDLPWRGAAVLGLLLGVAFWVRNDAVFLIASVGAVRVLPSLRRPGAVLRRRLLETVLFGAVAAAVAAPWMIYNATHFGSIVPVSGQAEKATEFAPSLPRLPAKLFEYLTVTGGLPNAMETLPVVQIVCAAALLAAVVVAARAFPRCGTVRRAALALTAVHGALLVGFYGLYFGAPHFLSRYLAPLSIPMALFTVGVAATWLSGARRRAALAASFLCLAAVAVVMDVRLYRNQHDHMHFQVVEWVRDHVQEDEWIGAIQTGTLGFFHDRTINLDGKTNPEALRSKGPVLMRQYILRTKIRHLVDWQGIADWIAFLSPEFEVVVHDTDKNLAVLERVR